MWFPFYWYIKIENFQTEKFRQKTSDKKVSDAFSGISDKKHSDIYDIKKQAWYQKDVKIDCDSIININLQKVHGDHHIYKDIWM